MFSSWISGIVRVDAEKNLFFKEFSWVWSCVFLCWKVYLELYNFEVRYNWYNTVKCGMWNVKMENGILRDNADFEYLISGEISKGTFNFCLCKI